MKRIVFLFILMAVCIPIGYYLIKQKPNDKLPIINPVDVKEEMVDPELLRLGNGHRVGSFNFQNQDSEWVTEKDMDGKISVVEYFFTTCKSICPIMNQEMQRVQQAFKTDNQIRIFSFTVDPETDTVAQMKRYAEKHGYQKKPMAFFDWKKGEFIWFSSQIFFCP